MGIILTDKTGPSMSKRSVGILLCIFFLIPAACARQVIRRVPAGDVSKEQTVVTEKKGPSTEERPAGPEIPVPPKSPGELASLRLTDQARRFLESGNAESAIRVLERSVALHPYNGEGYFLLAEAWILKKDPQRALTFHRLAQTYLKGEPSWEERIRDQHQKILSLK
ncbi:MAG: hypothetical protein COS92_02490 [Desulfobacterales bacterium CG07_land_8_20_14_0_80_52_14]|nr:MAG: hypothetical protein COS92_02490 [Desulfobacterales bacterium CG07_land_8_20_14_0_80_52_14]